MFDCRCLHCGTPPSDRTLIDANFCEFCHHKSRMPPGECDCPQCWLLPTDGIESPIAGLEFTLEPPPPAPEEVEPPVSDPQHAKFGEYLLALLAMLPADFETTNDVIKMLTESIIRLANAASGQRKLCERVALVEQIKMSLCATLELVVEDDDE